MKRWPSIPPFSLKDIGPHCKVREIIGGGGITRKPVAHKDHVAISKKRAAENQWHKRLFDAIVDRGYKPECEYAGAVPGRRYRIDIAFPDVKLAIEVDGWQHHGKTLDAFKKDRTRQNLLVVNGWRVLRFFPGEIKQDVAACVDMIVLGIKSK